ncbi:MAG: hypothetical protein Q7T96_01580 [Methylobacter sp.]|nr:hypothetical protein [Methylobacter sp.]
MKNTIIVAACIVMLSGCVSASRSSVTQSSSYAPVEEKIQIDIKTKYDEFKDRTDSYTHSEKSSYGILGYDLELIPDWGVETHGKERINEKSRIYGMIRSTSPSWKFSTCNDLIFLIDGERYSPTKISHDGFVNRNTGHLHVVEFVIYDIDDSIANRISSANSVRGQLCSVEFELSKDNKSALKSLISNLQNPVKSTK